MSFSQRGPEVAFWEVTGAGLTCRTHLSERRLLSVGTKGLVNREPKVASAASGLSLQLPEVHCEFTAKVFAFQIRSSWARFCRIVRFYRLQFSISSLSSEPMEIPIPPAGTSFSSRITR